LHIFVNSDLHASKKPKDKKKMTVMSPLQNVKVSHMLDGEKAQLWSDLIMV